MTEARMVIWIIVGWCALASVYTFALFGRDKSRAKTAGARRVSELHLLSASALGGFLGGLLGMMMFRHKTAKLSFKLKMALVILAWGVGGWFISGFRF